MVHILAKEIKLELKNNLFIPVNKPKLGKKERKLLIKCLNDNWISSEGYFVKKFESDFARFNEKKYGIATSNGTTALEVAIKALGIGQNDEVILPTFTIISCALAVIKNGATPVFVDARSDTWNMDVSSIEKLITKQTKAIMVVHTYGIPVEMDPVIEICRKYNLFLIEDAAQAHGLIYKGKRCGSFGDISIFSFYANKNITTGEGGMILTNNVDIAEKCYSIRNLCFIPDKRFFHKEIGGNYRLTNMQAAIGLAQLEKLEKTLKTKIKNGKKYEHYFSGNPKIHTPISEGEGFTNNYWVYGMVLRSEFANSINKLVNSLKNSGIETRPFFWPLHLQPALKKYIKQNVDDLKVSEYIASSGFYLPSGVGITRRELKYVAKTTVKYLNEI